MVEWLVETHYRFRLLDETLYVAVSIFDRYLAIKKTVPSKTRSVALASLLIASKYEDIYPPELNEMMKLMNEDEEESLVVSRKEVIDMESDILEVLGFDFTIQSGLRFLERYDKIANIGDKTFFIAQLLMEIAMCDSE
jgi:hypothetical protein